VLEREASLGGWCSVVQTTHSRMSKSNKEAEMCVLFCFVLFCFYLSSASSLAAGVWFSVRKGEKREYVQLITRIYIRSKDGYHD